MCHGGVFQLVDVTAGYPVWSQVRVLPPPRSMWYIGCAFPGGEEPGSIPGERKRDYGETVSHETSDLNFGFRLPVVLAVFCARGSLAESPLASFVYQLVAGSIPAAEFRHSV